MGLPPEEFSWEEYGGRKVTEVFSELVIILIPFLHRALTTAAGILDEHRCLGVSASLLHCESHCLPIFAGLKCHCIGYYMNHLKHASYLDIHHHHRVLQHNQCLAYQKRH